MREPLRRTRFPGIEMHSARCLTDDHTGCTMPECECSCHPSPRPERDLSGLFAVLLTITWPLLLLALLWAATR